MARRAARLLTLMAALAAGATQAQDLGDATAGAEVFRQCKVCHEVGPGARNRIGPHLNDLFGRRAAALERFQYSESLARAGRNGLEWHADTLDAYIANPRAFASGTRMNFRGLSDTGERADLIAYLRGFSAAPSDIPEADPTATATDHDIDPAILAIVGDPEYGEYLSGECKTCHQADGSADGIPSILQVRAAQPSGHADDRRPAERRGNRRSGRLFQRHN